MAANPGAKGSTDHVSRVMPIGDYVLEMNGRLESALRSIDTWERALAAMDRALAETERRLLGKIEDLNSRIWQLERKS